MAKLRLETSLAHNSIEQSPPMRAIFSENYSLAQYRMLLRRLWRFYLPFEEEVFGNLPRSLATKVEHRRKAAWLEADLCALGTQLPEESDGIDLNFHSFEERMGALYVTEGATLGGKIIRKQLVGRFGDRVKNALHFYTGYGSQGGAEWRAFRGDLGVLFDHVGAEAQAKVIAGANATFSALELWLAPLRGPQAHAEA